MSAENRQLSKATRELKRITARIAKDRDKLRDLRDEIGQIESDSEQALCCLDDAIELLSQQL